MNINKKPCIEEINITYNEYVKTDIDKETKNNIFIFDGMKMKDWNSLFDKFKKTLHFPSYFSYNKDSFEECLSDLDEWLSTPIYILFITNSNKLLINENNYKEEYKELIDIFDDVCFEYHQKDMEEKYPFRVLLSNTQTIAQSSIKNNTLNSPIKGEGIPDDFFKKEK